MRLVSKLYVSFAILLSVALVSAVIAFSSAREVAFHLERTHFAHRQYEAYLSLSTHTYQLFKQFADAMLIGDRDRGAGETELIGRIRADIEDIRRLIGQEIQLVGDEEIEELSRLSAIERQIDTLLDEYGGLIGNGALGEFPSSWGRLSHVLDEKVDRDFNALIEEALADEAEEVRETREETARIVQFYETILWVFGLIGVGAAAASLGMLIRDIRRPIRKLTEGAVALAAGNVTHRVVADGRSELEDVCRAFNSMAERVASREAALSKSKDELEDAVVKRTAELERVLEQLKSNEANRRRLLADVSHELRTPLTIIQGEADIALRGDSKPPEVYREALERSRDAAKHTARLVDDLLFIARREAGETRLRLEPLDLVALLAETVADCRTLANGNDSSIVGVTDLQQATVRGDGDRIRQVMIILVENALRYGVGPIEVRLDQAPNGFAISVADRGPGMTEEEQARAFERFFRGSNAAQVYTKGAGLGLPVAKAIVEAHSGTITLRSSPDAGTTVTIVLPTRPRLEAVA